MTRSSRLTCLSLGFGLSFLAVGFATAQVQPAPGLSVAGLELKPNGTFTWDQITAAVGHFDVDWHSTDQTWTKPAAGYPKVDGTVWATRDFLATKSATGPIALSERLERVDDRSFRISYEATHPTGAPTQEVSLQLELPLGMAAGQKILVDGVACDLPALFKEARLFVAAAGKHTVVLPAASGTVTVEGEFSALLQDQRQWKHDAYGLRLRFSPGGATLIKAGLVVTLRHTPYRSTPLFLREAVNFGFRDDVGGDHRGGWTDQGPENDIRALPTGPLTAAGVAFDIIDAGANHGRGAIVLGKTDQDFLPRGVSVPVPADGKNWRNLYLLHASGWTPPSGTVVGSILFHHSDGSESSREVVSGRDVGNWWAPAQLAGAAVGWTGVNARNRIGLYVSRIPLDGRPLKEIRFESAGTAMWMIAGVSGSADDIVPCTPVEPWTAVANEDWAPYQHRLEIEPGSVFDFSGRIETPAGKYGPLTTTPQGHFEFAGKPGVRARFWGVNLCFSANLLDKDVADLLAGRLARSGYNSVRLHHYDREIQLKGGASDELDPEQLDRFEYLFAALKKRGLYVNIDLYTIRGFSPGELAAIGFDPHDGGKGDMIWRFKAAMPVSEAAFDAWAKFARNFITHRNPYTGLTWAEDPALIGVCPVNENFTGELVDADPVLRRLYQDAFVRWWESPANHARAGEDRPRAFNRFVFESQLALELRMRAFLRGLGLKAPVTGTNHDTSQGLAFVRASYDYVDNHQYWDHPSFPLVDFRLPFQFAQASAVSFAAQTPRGLMPTRILGKPFTVTEFNYVRPNRYRAEGGVLMPAYAGLQDWDALYNFDYSSTRENVTWPGREGIFSLAADPIGQLADRVGAVLFLRGDVAAAKNEIGFAVQPDTAFAVRQKPFPDVFSRLGLVTRIGSRPAAVADLASDAGLAAVVVEPADFPGTGNKRIYPADAALPTALQRDGVLPPGSISPDGTGYASDTGQIELQSKRGTVKVVTPRSELFVLPPAAKLDGSCVTVSNGETFGAVMVLAVDGRPLPESDRLLVLHLTDALPTGMRFAGQDRCLQETAGVLPHLVQRGSATIGLKLATRGEWRAWAVDATGKHQREVPLKRGAAAGLWTLEASTVTEGGTQLAYELVR